MCKWWEDNQRYFYYMARESVDDDITRWNIGVVEEGWDHNYDVIDIPFCPGCGNRLSSQGCVDNKCQRCGRPSKENWCVFCQTYKYIEMVKGEGHD